MRLISAFQLATDGSGGKNARPDPKAPYQTDIPQYGNPGRFFVSPTVGNNRNALTDRLLRDGEQAASLAPFGVVRGPLRAGRLKNSWVCPPQPCRHRRLRRRGYGTIHQSALPVIFFEQRFATDDWSPKPGPGEA